MRDRRIAIAAMMTVAMLPGLAAAQGQAGQSTNNQSPSQSGSVSQDLLSIYQQTKTEQSIQSVTAIARACSEVIPNPARSKIDREYASNLLAWALNRRGEMRSERAATLVQEGNLSAADKLDSQAAQDFKTAIEYGPPNWRMHHNYAISLAMQGDYQQAIAEFSRAIELQPEYANAYFNRAELYFELGRYDIAVDDYSQAISINAADPQYYNSRAHSRFMLEDYEQAIGDYRRAAELGKDSAIYLTDLADAYQFRAQWKPAAAAYQQAVSVNNQYARAYQNAAWLMATCPDAEIRNQELALTAAKRAIALEGDDSAKALDTLAAATANMGDFSEAAKLTRQAIEISQEEDETIELKQRLNLYSQRRAYRQSDGQASAVANRPNPREYRIRTASGGTTSER